MLQMRKHPISTRSIGLGSNMALYELSTRDEVKRLRMCPHGNVRCTSPTRCTDDQCLGGDYDAIAQGLQTDDDAGETVDIERESSQNG